MKHVQLQATTREVFGHSVKTLRKNGSIPAVVYSKKVKSEPLTVVFSQFYHVFKEAGKTQVIDLQVDESKKVIPCIVHDIDVHPVTGLPLHIDFLAVNLKEKITSQIPVEIEGESDAVKELGAVLNVIDNELEVEALPDDLPSSIVIDVSVLKTMEDIITIADLIKPDDKYKFTGDPEKSVVTLVAQSVDEEPETNETVVEGEDGAQTTESAASDDEQKESEE